MTVYTTSPGINTQIDYNGGTNATYIGIAVSELGVSSSTLQSLPVWQIKNIAYDGNNNPLSITWGNAGANNLVWNNRTSSSIVYG